MITYRLDRHKYSIPDRWDDFTPGNARKFIALCRVFDLFESEKINFRTLETAVAAALLGMDVMMIPRQNDILAENIFR